MAQSPLLSAYAENIAAWVISIELGIVIVLAIPKYRRMGLYASYGIMVAFTVYIYLILNFSDFVPCPCGGVLEQMGWTEHLIFNIGASILAIGGIIVNHEYDSHVEGRKSKNSKYRSKILIVVGLGTMSMFTVIMLWLSSQYINVKGENFTRKILPNPIIQVDDFELQKQGFYFAGASQSDLYLGNLYSPLQVTKISLKSNMVESINVNIKDEGDLFRMLKIKFRFPWLYIYDGTVPVLYRRKWNSDSIRKISYKKAYFNQLVVMDSTTFPVRTRSSKNRQYILGLLRPFDKPNLSLYDGILTKQIDGIFDSDGSLMYDSLRKTIVYTYAYRNKILVMDEKMNLLKTLNTIDPIAETQLKTVALNNGINKIASPTMSVNKYQSIYNGILLNISGIMSKSDSPKLWRKSTVVDIYNVQQQQYLGSFYLKLEKAKISGIWTTNDHLFVIYNNKLIKYRYRNVIAKHFDRGNRKPSKRVGTIN